MQSYPRIRPGPAPAGGGDAAGPRFFDSHQRATIAAAMARIIPSDDTPGAHEAGAIDFLDRYLSGTGCIYARPDGSGFERLADRSERAWRIRIAIMRAKYVDGVRELDSRSHETFGADFMALAPGQQDTVLKQAEASVGAPDGPALQQTSTEVELGFFPLLVAHTRQGFLADPIYGGNRGHVGWAVIGFPGPASLAEVHQGRYATIGWFAEGHTDPDPDRRTLHHGA